MQARKRSVFKNLAPVLRRLRNSDTFRAGIILFGLLNVCFFTCLWGNKSLLASAQDAASVIPSGAWAGQPVHTNFSKTLDNGAPSFLGEPWLALLHYEYFHEHVFPLWNPYQGFGHPLAANQESQPAYPLMLALLLRVSPKTYNWYLLSRLFSAGISCYLFLRFFVSFWPAVAGGITSMLAGYYVLFISMPQLSVEVLIPASLLAAEYLIRKRTYRSLAAFAVVLSLVFLGGMPESALLLLLLLYLYLAFRILSDAALFADWHKVVMRLAAATAAGIGLSLFFLLPFWELMHRSFDVHQPQNIGGAITGLLHDPPGISIFTYFFPLIFGPPFTPTLGTINDGLRNYFGVISTFLLLTALAIALVRLHQKDPLRSLTLFFSAVVLLLILKRYGFPGINWVGALPYLRLVGLTKYEEALVSISVSVLAAIGIERLVRRQVPVPLQALALALIASLLPFAYLFSRNAVRHAVVQLNLMPALPRFSMQLPAVLLATTAMLLVLARAFNGRASSRTLGIAFALILSIEFSACFIGPVYYWYNQLPYATHNPYLGAPYINEIRKDQGHYRTFARGGLLFPNWASVFRIYDIRNLDAMYDKKYFPFLLNFFPDQKNSRPPFDLGDRFNGTGTYDLTTPLARRLLQLSSVRYIATLKPFAVPNRIVEEILAQNQGHLLPGREINIENRAFLLGAEARESLGEHPPYERLPYRLHVGDDRHEIFRFSYGLDPFVFDKPGDGVVFIVEVEDLKGAITKVFSGYIDPKHNPAERRWMDGQVDLTPYRGKPVTLLFTTTPGPKGDTAFAWAAWSNFHFEEHEQEVTGQAPPFKLIYDADAKVYRYDNVLPRAAIFSRVESAQGESDVLRKLAGPKVNIFESVVLDELALTPEQREQVAEINRHTPQRVESAEITSYTSQDVRIQASLNEPGVLVLNDTAYPGWSVEVNGQPTSWINANYMFRGVFLRPGTYSVRFAYRPRSFYVGLVLSLVTLMALIVGAFVSYRHSAGLATATHSPHPVPVSDAAMRS